MNRWWCVAVGLAVWATLTAWASRGEPPTSRDGRRMRLVSYNIQALSRGQQGVVDILHALGPDVVALQEVDVGTRRSGRVNQAQLLGKKLEMHAHFALAMDHDGGHYGLALLSRHRLREVEVLKLPRRGTEEPRIAMRARTRVQGEEVVVVNTHLAADWKAVDPATLRREQAVALDAWLKGLPGKTPVLLMGDLNCQPGSEAFEVLAQRARRLTGDQPTYPAESPTLALDHMFMWGAPASWKVVRREVVPSQASDHRPVLLELGLAEPGSDAQLDRPVPP